MTKQGRRAVYGSGAGERIQRPQLDRLLRTTCDAARPQRDGGEENYRHSLHIRFSLLLKSAET